MLYRPENVQKFDTTIQVDILGWKTISLRMGGQVEYPVVDLDIVSLIHIIFFSIKILKHYLLSKFI